MKVQYRPLATRPARRDRREYAPVVRASTPARSLPHPSRRWLPSGAHPTVRRSVTALGTIPLFDGLAKRHMRQLADEADVVRFRSGRAIVEQGQGGEAMYVMLSGTATVVRGGRSVARLIPGDFFGELSALDGGPRSASVVADTPVEVLRLFRHTLLDVLRTEPTLVFRMLEGLARRLRQVRPGTPAA
jgi:CRP/FNR family transcriptional regulator, cyclic AMP receptor protein